MTGGMMFKGTPGPWVADEYMSGHDGIYIRSKSRHWSIAAVHATDGCTDSSMDLSELEAAANANLIAAALELLDNGQFLLDRLAEFESELEDDVVAREFYGHVSPAIARFRAAIAKALGEKK